MTLPRSIPGVDSAEAPRVIFEREGWLLVPRLLDRTKLDALLAATGELERVAAHFEHDTHARRVFFEMQSTSGKKGEPAIFPGALRKITFLRAVKLRSIGCAAIRRCWARSKAAAWSRPNA